MPKLFKQGNVFPLISGVKVALNRLRPRERFNATFPPDIKGKTLDGRQQDGTQVCFMSSLPPPPLSLSFLGHLRRG